MTKNITLLASAVAAAALAAPAQAALTATGVSCSGHATGLPALAGYVDCSGAWSGNNLNQADDVAAQIAADWSLTNLVALDVTAGHDASTGTLNFGTQSGLFVLALKAGNAFSLYEFDGAAVAGGISSIAYDTLGVGFFSPGNNKEHFGRDLSHATIYVPVPEPGTVALLLAGLGAMALVRRRTARR